MARRKVYENPMWPLSKAASNFKVQTLQQLRANMITQAIWPTEVYHGYRAINEYHKAHGGWYSTGEGANSFEGSVNGDDKIGNLEMHFWFNDYLRYVDLGVGKGVDAGDVERSRKANYRTRYTSRWARSHGRSHRPAIMMELRHLAARLEKYALDFYGYEGQFRVLEALPDEIDIPVV